MPWLPWGLKTLRRADCHTAYNSTIQAISHSFMSIPIVTRRHTTGSKGKPVAWAQECMATHLTCPSHSHVKPPKLTQRQWPGRGGWMHLGAPPARTACSSTMLAIPICILTTARHYNPLHYKTMQCHDCHGGWKHLGVQTARTAFNSTIQAISHSFMSIPIVTRRHTTGSKGKPVAWAQECMATHLTCPSHSHVKPPKLTQRQWPGRGGWMHLGAPPARTACSSTMLAIPICILTTARHYNPLHYKTMQCHDCHGG